MANPVGNPTRVVRFLQQAAITLIAACGLATGASAQTTVTFSAAGTHINVDTTIQGGGFATVDFSTSGVLASKVSSNESYTRRILLKFDTQNYIPQNAVIQSAKLYLVLKGAESSESRSFAAFRVTKSFVNRQTNWRYFRDAQAWSSGGGDLGERFATTQVGNALGTTHTFDLTQLVQRTVNGEFGSRYTRVALVDTGAPGANYKEFHSTRAADPNVRPRLVVTYGGSSTTTTSTTSSTSTTSTTTSTSGTTLRVVQWNVRKTKGLDGVCNPDRIADWIVRLGAHVASINEINYFSGECAWTFDMSERLRSLLQQKTGVTWYKRFVNVLGNTDRGYGNALLSRFPFSSSSTRLLSYERGVAQATIVVNGRNVNLFSTHVEYYTSWWRPIQIREALAWINSFAEPRIIMGDFNTNPGTSDYNLVASPYQDAWVAARNAGTATSYNGTGNTHGGSRFDYVFYSRVSALSLQSVNVPDTRTSGVFPSDHDPVVATFRVN
jgi:endonuclease/exonuclease/phosphatase family metal-dependent hydrolase